MEDIKYKYFSELGHFPADTQIIIEDALAIYKELEHNDEKTDYLHLPNDPYWVI